MDKCSVLVWDNGKSHSNILHAQGCDISETLIDKCQDVLTKFNIMFVEFFKESYRIHACVTVATPWQRKRWNHQTPVTVVIDI